MPITKQSVISHIGILEDGQLQIRLSQRIFEDGVLLAEKYHRRVLAPGDSTTNEDSRVSSIAALLWTPQVIADYEAAKNAAK